MMSVESAIGTAGAGVESTPAPPVSVLVVTRDRLDSLVRCLLPLARLGDEVGEVLIFDDASDPPVEVSLKTRLRRHAQGDAGREEVTAAGWILKRLRVVRDPARPGYVVARNRLAGLATGRFLLSLDDDAEVAEPDAVRRGLAVIGGDPSVGAVAFAQSGGDDLPWRADWQPAVVDYPCQVPSFIGFAALLRRESFLRLGGYREAFVHYGEEKEYSLRLLDARMKVIYLPAARVRHWVDTSDRRGRDALVARTSARNNCLAALYNLPLPLVGPVWWRAWRGYIHQRRHLRCGDVGGSRWLAAEVARHAVRIVLRERRPVRWSTLARWRQLRRDPEPYSVVGPSVIAQQSEA